MDGSRGNSRGNRDPRFEHGDPFAGFGGFAGHRSLMSGIFGGRDPFDDPFFARPFGGLFESDPFGVPGGHPFMNTHPSGFPMGGSLLGHPPPSGFPFGGSPFMNAQPSGFLEQQPYQTNRSNGPIIEELNSDDEEGVEGREEKEGNPRKHVRSSNEAYVDHPDDQVEGRNKKQLHYFNGFDSQKNTQPQPHPQGHSFTFQSSSVSYGGSNGAYYTKSRTMRTGSDGLTIDESKEADSTTGQAAHRLSRGIHDKGHTVSRNLHSDGKVDTKQILHNLEKDDLDGFEETWRVNANKSLPGWREELYVQNGSGSSGQSGSQSRGGRALPSTEPLYLQKPGGGDMPSSQSSGKRKVNHGN